MTQKRRVQIATFPGKRGTVVMEGCTLLPQAVLAPNILYTGLTNMNAVLHVANCVSNAGRIESGGDFKFYAEGVTPAVVNLYQALDAERLAIAARLGVTTPSLEEWIGRALWRQGAVAPGDVSAPDLRSAGPYQNTPTPTSLAHKYITEDVPTGLIPIRALGVAGGVATPTWMPSFTSPA